MAQTTTSAREKPILQRYLQPLLLPLLAILTSFLIGALVIIFTAENPAVGLEKTIAGYRGLIEGALLNLIVNAADASAEQGEITIETEIVTEAPTVRGSRFFRLRVTDAGTGMSEEVLKQIFDPFFTTKGPGKGTGLGLSQVYGFVKQSGGHVRLHSRVGQGTAVRIYLPRSLQKPARSEPPRAIVDDPGEELDG